MSQYTQSWVAWLLLLLLIGLGAVEIFQPGRYVRTFESMFSSKERDSIFLGSGNDLRSHWTLVVVSLLEMSLALMWYRYPQGDYAFDLYLRFLCYTIAFALARFLMQKLVGYIFFSRSETETYARHYQYLNDSLVLLGWPILLVGLFWDAASYSLIAGVFVVLLIGYGLLVLYKLIACFHLRWISLLYIPLYFITTEVLPFAALLFLTSPEAASL